jgi:hypothetical protein
MNKDYAKNCLYFTVHKDDEWLIWVKNQLQTLKENKQNNDLFKTTFHLGRNIHFSSLKKLNKFFQRII